MNTNPESKRFHQRSIVCASIILFLFFVLLIRLMYLQLIEHGFYATLSKRNVISIIPVKPDRGLIYDRNGVVLEKIIPLTKEEIQNFNHIVKQYYPYQTVPLKQQLTESEVDSFYVNQYRFPGVTVQSNMI